MKAFNSTTEVTNYPMRERTKAETDELEFVTKQRRLEIMEDDIRKENLDAQTATNPPLVGEYLLCISRSLAIRPRKPSNNSGMMMNQS